VNFFKKLVDGINYAEYPVTDHKPSYFDETIVEIVFSEFADCPQGT